MKTAPPAALPSLQGDTVADRPATVAGEHALARARRELDLSQGELARRAGYSSYKQLWRFEQGDRVPSLEGAERIAAVVGREVTELWGDPRACGCGCGRLGLSAFVRGHGIAPSREAAKLDHRQALDAYKRQRDVFEVREFATLVPCSKTTVDRYADELPFELYAGKWSGRSPRLFPRAAVDRLRELMAAEQEAQRARARQRHQPGGDLAKLRVHPKADERTCETCGERFTPQDGQAARGGGRFCKRACYFASPEAKEHAREGGLRATELVAAELARLKADGDLLDTPEVAAKYGVQPASVFAYVHDGLLMARAVDVGGQRHYLYERDEVERLRKSWRREGDGRRKQCLDPDHVVKVWRARGWLTRFAERREMSEADAEVVVRARVRQRRKLLPPASGRKNATGPSERHLRWKAMLKEAKRELEEDHRLQTELGHDEPAPTLWDAFKAVAEHDWADHPEDWPRSNYPPARGDPGALHPDWAYEAADKVRNAPPVKSLLIARKKIHGR